MFLWVFYIDDVFNRWAAATSSAVNMASHFLRHFRRSSISNVNFFLLIDKTLVADITIKIIRKLCCFRKIDKRYMLMLASMELLNTTGIKGQVASFYMTVIKC